MKARKRAGRFAALAGTLATLCATSALANDQVKAESGVVEGVAATSPGVRIFRGVPLAAPPIGALRWKAPQPVKPWKGVRKAAEFGPRCMQAPIYPDMIFRDRADKPMSEDCLYLNVWTPAKSAQDGLSVMRADGFATFQGIDSRSDWREWRILWAPACRFSDAGAKRNRKDRNEVCRIHRSEGLGGVARENC